jgi:hypothetical protein
MFRKLRTNKQGVAPLTSHLIILAITVLAMVVVVNTSLTVIANRHDQMGERVYVENVFFNTTNVKISIRNIGYCDITLKEAQINNKLYNIEDIELPGPATDSTYSVKSIVIADSFEKGIYQIRFISTRNNVLGSVEVEYR